MDTGFAGRLAEPFVLAILARGPLHGYGILQELEEAFGPGSIAKARIYQILRRLEKDGVVTPLEGEGNRKAYTLTESGRLALDEMGSPTSAFFKLLGMLFANMELAAPSQAATPANGNGKTDTGHIPRDGARSQMACPGCAELQIKMERTLPGNALHIDIDRPEGAAMHHEACVVSLALRRLAASLLP